MTREAPEKRCASQKPELLSCCARPCRHVPLADRIYAKLAWDGSCLVWTGALTKGYGTVGAPYVAGETNRTRRVHRLVYEMHNGPIPEDKWIDHLCRNPACACPDHLELVTPGENTRRGWVLRKASHCGNGHEWTPQNTKWVKSRPGQRACRACHRAWDRKARERKAS